MNPLAAYQNRILLVDGDRFAPFIAKAVARPCPSAADVRQAHREWLTLAAELPGAAVQGTGRDDPEEVFTWEMSDGKVMKESASTAPKAIRATKGKIGIINIFGPVDQRMTSELEKAGGTPLDFVGAALDTLLGNSAVSAIVLRMDCPGGSASGIEEMADRIVQARSQKPIYAHVDSLAASAGYWLASAASMVICTPSGECGSVGVFITHVDESEAMAQDGLKVTMVHAGKNKIEFSPYAPLSDDAKAELQSRVNSIYDKFTSSLSSNLGVPIGKVRSDFGEGRTVPAQKALAAGMVHRVLSWNDFMAKLSGGSSASSQGPRAEAAARADVVRISKARRDRAS